MKKSMILKLGVLLIICTLFISFFIYWQNNIIEVTSIDYRNKKIPTSFNGYKIVHISDLHNKEFGERQSTILLKIKKIKPDLILLTGDMIDRRRYNLKVTMDFIEGAVKIAPVYFVTGNHEAWSGKWEEIKKEFLTAGVNILDDEKLEIYKKNEKINLIGFNDIDFLTSSYLEGSNINFLKERLSSLADESTFSILLSHRPELINLYAAENIDLVFSGHAHGGQIRLPFIGGIYAPDQGFFPKYTSGAYTVGNTTEVVSRGLGNSLFPLRIFNEPEIIVVTLNNDK